MSNKTFEFDKWLTSFCKDSGCKRAAVEATARQLLLDSRAKECDNAEEWLIKISDINRPQLAEVKVVNALWGVLFKAEKVEKKVGKPTKPEKELP